MHKNFNYLVDWSKLFGIIGANYLGIIWSELFVRFVMSKVKTNIDICIVHVKELYPVSPEY